jgi:5'-3' exonuclease
VLQSVLQILERGETHVGVATDHVIESFRNGLWPGYKTGAGSSPALFAQFHPLEDALAAMGVVVWPMVELEADDALASAAHLANSDDAVDKVCIWTPDKDLAQCVVDDRVVQVDRRAKTVRDAAGVRAKFGVVPRLIPDWLALVGDVADGYPGIAGIGAVGAARLLNRHGPIEAFPTPSSAIAATKRCSSSASRRCAPTPGSSRASALRWRGPTAAFASWAERANAPRLLERARAAQALAAGKT